MNIPLNIDWQQIVLHLFNFVILAGGLYILLYKPVKAFMNKREAYYQGLSDAAKAELDRAGTLKKSLDEKWNAAEDEIRQQKAAAAVRLEQEQQQSMEETRKECEGLLQKAKEAAETEKQRILEEARGEAALLAVSAIEKLSLSAEGSSLNKFLEEAERGKRT